MHKVILLACDSLKINSNGSLDLNKGKLGQGCVQKSEAARVSLMQL